MSTIDSGWNWWQTKRQISRKYCICLHRNMALPLYTYALNLHLRLLHQNIQKCNCALDTQKSERALNFNYMTTQKSIWICYFQCNWNLGHHVCSWSKNIFTKYSQTARPKLCSLTILTYNSDVPNGPMPHPRPHTPAASAKWPAAGSQLSVSKWLMAAGGERISA